MKAEDIEVGDLVKCENSFNLSYKVIEKFDKWCTLQYKTGNKVMKGGELIDEVFTYTKIRYSKIKSKD